MDNKDERLSWNSCGDGVDISIGGGNDLGREILCFLGEFGVVLLYHKMINVSLIKVS